jgi:hypothetical protein
MTGDSQEYRRGYEDGREAGPLEQIGVAIAAVPEVGTEYARGLKDGLAGKPFAPEPKNQLSGPERTEDKPEVAGRTTLGDHRAIGSLGGERSAPRAVPRRSGLTADLATSLYFLICGVAWAFYLGLVLLASFGIVEPGQVEALDEKLRSIVVHPIGIIVVLFFSVGLLIVGICIAVALVALLPAIVLPVTLLRVGGDAGPMLAVFIGVPCSVLYLRWLFRRFA